ncbi:hypothetical protein C475_15563 [Halosimplex carlsbadense 2-9-1]|uniref:Uncharacterized protein n=1 Tax=Halosimplex carlsbadense 2-9-1 TaxID=797114 RepID=M0CMS0_9EURY|nr:hypothetical protein [Halosimplex carlsbadense]ELZ23702.1 hypothetical protein C475_15563 [Halosimplex carlsbadense 2-9-1]
MGFEKFDETGRGRGRPAGTSPKISLRKSGSVGVNQAALEEYFEDDDGAILYFDEEEDRIGIEPVGDNDADEAAYTVSKTDSGGTIAGQAFLETYELLPEITTQYVPEWDDDNGLVTVDLDDPAKTYGSADGDETE